MNRCTWTETITFEKFINEPHYDEIKNEQRQIQCNSLTEEQFDEYGRAYCKEHRIKVDEINKSRHKNCINKEKLKEKFKQEVINEYKQKIIIWLNKQIKTCLCDELKEVGKLTAYYKIIEFIENGNFDND